MNKKIAVLSTAWNAEYVGTILSGMVRKARELGVNLYIFNNFGGSYIEENYNVGEYNIFYLPDLESMDAVLIIANNAGSLARMEKLIAQIREKNIPCISIEQDIEGIHFVGTDNYAAMCTMVEHLIEKHRCRVLNFVAGPADHIESMERDAAFVDTLKKYGIQADPDRISYQNFMKEGGERAFDYFRSKGLERADAIVCANDDMAIGYIDAAKQWGMKVPMDFLVTGFDDSVAGAVYNPSISSIGRSKGHLGEQCVEQIVNMIDGTDYPQKIYAPHHFRAKDSCGCGLAEDKFRELLSESLDKLSAEKTDRWGVNTSLKRLSTCRDSESLRSAFYVEASIIGLRNFCILLDGEKFLRIDGEQDDKTAYECGYPEKMRLFFSKQDVPYEGPEEIETKKLFPKGFGNPKANSQVYVFSPVHLGGVHFGYCVFEDGVRHIENMNLFYWQGIYGTVFENLRQNIQIRELNKKLSEMYQHDAMTGLYNRFALKTIVEPLVAENRKAGKNTLFFFVDIDDLKVVNDTYGHDCGDAAILTIANTIREVCPEDDYCTLRFGGDEFISIGDGTDEESAEELKRKIEQKLADINSRHIYPYNLSASVGYMLAYPQDEDKNLDYYISRADEMMYRIKKDRKNKA